MDAKPFGILLTRIPPQRELLLTRRKKKIIEEKDTIIKYLRSM